MRLNAGQLPAGELINTEMHAIDDIVRGAEKKTVNPSWRVEVWQKNSGSLVSHLSPASQPETGLQDSGDRTHFVLVRRRLMVGKSARHQTPTMTNWGPEDWVHMLEKKLQTLEVECTLRDMGDPALLARQHGGSVTITCTDPHELRSGEENGM